jgi:hypothetical protein
MSHHKHKHCTNHPDQAGINALMTDIVYWSRDLMEHCIFHQFALDGNPALAAQAGALAAQWQAFISGGYVGGLPAAKALALQTIALEQAIVNYMQGPFNLGTSGWVGWLSVDVYTHCIEEAQAFVDSIDGKVWTPQELRDLWVKWNAEHAQNGQSFIAPKSAEKQLDESRKISDRFYEQRAKMLKIGEHDNKCDPALDKETIDLGIKYNEFLDSLHVGEGAPAEVPTVYIPLVITHVKAETDAANQILRLLDCECSSLDNSRRRFPD